MEKETILNTYVALLRGINVGGRNKLPMSELTSILKQLGLHNIRTYIQSGNVLFDADDIDQNEMGRKIADEIESRKGFAPRTLILPLGKLREAAASNPFPQAEQEPSRLHLAFAQTPPLDPDVELLESLRSQSESFKLLGDVLYLHAPEGIGRSKLAANIERGLGGAATMRNWRTVQKLLSMAAESDVG